MLENNLLVHELQLGSQLSQSVHSGRRADFSLMLAMLSDDVREHSQFLLPVSEKTTPEESEEKLRKRFQLPEPAPLAIKDPQEIKKFNQAHFILEQRLADLHLENTLKPLPLSMHDDVNYIEPEILANTSIHCQRRYQQATKKPGLLAKATTFDAKAWLAGIEKTLVSAPMVTNHNNA